MLFILREMKFKEIFYVFREIFRVFFFFIESPVLLYEENFTVKNTVELFSQKAG